MSANSESGTPPIMLEAKPEAASRRLLNAAATGSSRRPAPAARA